MTAQDICQQITNEFKFNPVVNCRVKKDGVEKQRFALTQDAKKEGFFYLQGRAAESQPMSVFAGIFEKAIQQGFTIEVW